MTHSNTMAEEEISAHEKEALSRLTMLEGTDHRILDDEKRKKVLQHYAAFIGEMELMTSGITETEGKSVDEGRQYVFNAFLAIRERVSALIGDAHMEALLGSGDQVAVDIRSQSSSSPCP